MGATKGTKNLTMTMAEEYKLMTFLDSQRDLIIKQNLGYRSIIKLVTEKTGLVVNKNIIGRRLEALKIHLSTNPVDKNMSNTGGRLAQRIQELEERVTALEDGLGLTSKRS